MNGWKSKDMSLLGIILLLLLVKETFTTADCQFHPPNFSKLTPTDLYLNLLKNTLAGVSYAGTQEKTVFVGLGDHSNLQRHSFDPRLRSCGMDIPLVGLTMVGLRRLEQLQAAVEGISAKQVPGDIVECGVWKGGASAYLLAILRLQPDCSRKIWLADSYQGFEEASFSQDSSSGVFPVSIWTGMHIFNVTEDSLKANLKWLNLHNQVNYVIVKGYFKDSLPRIRDQISAISLLRLDGDSYESTMDILYNLYVKVSFGGLVIIDDWALATARQAVSDFRRDHAIYELVEMTDLTAAYWTKQRQVIVNRSEWVNLPREGSSKQTLLQKLISYLFMPVKIAYFLCSGVYGWRSDEFRPSAVNW